MTRSFLKSLAFPEAPRVLETLGVPPALGALHLLWDLAAPLALQFQSCPLSLCILESLGGQLALFLPWVLVPQAAPEDPEVLGAPGCQNPL